MARGISGKNGQSSLPDYVVTFFIVIAAAVAMTVYIQRSLQAKTKDARDYMVGLAASECGPDCRAAAGISGNGIPREYEPYYGHVDSRVSRNSDSRIGLSTGKDEPMTRDPFEAKGLDFDAIMPPLIETGYVTQDFRVSSQLKDLAKDLKDLFPDYSDVQREQIETIVRDAEQKKHSWFRKSTDETVETDSASSQLPPAAAAGDRYGR